MPSPTPAMQSPGLLRRMARLLLLASLPMTAAVAAEDTAPAGPLALKPGQFLWHPEIAPDGPVVLVVSLDQQLAYVYRNGIAIGISTISSGKPGKDTPTGVFTILQKNKDHKSNLYNNAPMPYMQRLTWDGIALHGGTLPGYPASHGCVRLPHPFAAKVYGITRTGDTVVVSDARAALREARRRPGRLLLAADQHPASPRLRGTPGRARRARAAHVDPLRVTH